MKSLRAVPSLIEEIRRDQAEVVEIGEALTFYGSGVVKRIVDQYVFSDPPRRRFGRSSAKDSCVILGPMGHALYSIGKEAIPIVEKQVEGHSYFDLEIQRRLDVLEAILRAWKNPEIAVRRIGQIGVPGADLVTPPQNSNPPPGGRRAGAR